jgi:all-trans-retinol 13,14-reductase
MTAKKDVIVVGAGISGLLTALSLSKEGKDVLLLEEMPAIGGVCRSYMVDGYQVDTGAHIITRIGQGPLRDLMTKYFDVVPNFIPHGKYYVLLNNRVRPFPWNLQGWFNFDIIPEMDRIYLVKTLFSVSYSFNSGENFSKKSLADILGTGLSTPTMRFLDCMSMFLTGASMKETPVARFLDSESYKNKSSNVLEKLYNALMKEGALDQVYPKGGLQSLVTAIETSFPKGKVEFKCEEKVLKIDPDKKTVETSKGEYGYETIVYSAYACELPKIVDDLSEDYKKSLKNLPKTSALMIWLGLDEQLFTRDGSEIWGDSDPYMWVVPTTNYDKSLAPKGKQLVGFMSRLPDGSDPKKEKKRALEAIYRVMPEIEKKVDMIHYQTLIPEKAAWTVNTQFTGIRTPMKDFYLVGTDTEKRSMGITRASYSVLKLLDTLKEDKKL